jgi:hypothetical protein
VLLLAMLILLVSAAAAEAQPIAVSVTNDPTGAGDCLNGGTCSLRQAVAAAASGDTITLPAGTYSLTQGTNISVSKSLTFQGAGAGATSTTIDGSQNPSGTTQPGTSTRILRVNPGATVTIQALTFADGSDANDETCSSGCSSTLTSTGGGALFNNGGSVILDGVSFTSDSAPIGGAVSNGPGGTLTMTDVSFTGNNAAFGGGLFSRGGQVTGTGVTFENNGGGGFGGGAAFLTGGTASLTNATIVGNGWASSFGGGIVNADANLTLVNDTFSGNLRGALETDAGTTAVANTIIGAGFSDNVDYACIAPGKQNSGGYTSSSAVTVDRGNNIDEDGHCGLSGAGDMSNVDARLAPIFGNTGPTRTQALLSGSPALGDPASSDFCPATDQRGIARPSGRCDIGAFEAVIAGAPSTPQTDAPQNVTETSADFAATINLTGEAGGFHFLFGRSSDPATWTATPEAAAGAVSSDTSVTETTIGLNPGTTYYYTAVADNASKSTPSENVQHFTTPPGAPVISNVSVESVTDTTAVIDFTVDPQGSDTSYFVNYGADAGYGNQTPAGDAGPDTGPKPETVTLTNLTPSGTIHFQVVAGNVVHQGVTSDDQTLTTATRIHGVAGAPLQVSDSGLADGCPSAPTVDWGDDNSDNQASINCTDGPDDSTAYSVSDSHTYTAPGRYLIRVIYDDLGTETDEYAQVASAPAPPGQPPPGQPPPSQPPATQQAPPSVSGGAPTTKASSGAAVSGSVNPQGIQTQAFFEYGLDLSERGPGASTTLYDQQTPAQQVGSDTAAHTVTAPLTGLIPGALYHIRLVAINTAGTTFGPDQTFTTAAAPAPPPPVLGQSQDVKPVSGKVFIKSASGQFIPLTGATKIPNGSVIDATHGSLQIVAALGKGKTDRGTFGGAIFKLTQTRSGLTTLSLVEGAFAGAPSFALCKALKKAADATAAALSSKTLQLLHASAHGKFKTSGRYSAATVRGTSWTIADRCDGTLTHDITDSVLVNDFVHHKSIILHAGQSYLARARG